MLREKAVTRQFADYSQVVALMEEAFPKNERLPMWYLRLLTFRKSIQFTAYYDGDAFVGLTYLVADSYQVFVLYLATRSEFRSKGYGRQILEAIQARHPGKALHLNIERLDQDAANAAQRLKRLAFYQNNGFHDTGYALKDGDDGYTILSTNQEFSAQSFNRLVGQLSFGMWKPKLEKG